jgi:hypothetical protein
MGGIMKFALSGLFFLGSIRVLAFQGSPYSLQHGVLVHGVLHCLAFDSLRRSCKEKSLFPHIFRDSVSGV